MTETQNDLFGMLADDAAESAKLAGSNTENLARLSEAVRIYQEDAQRIARGELLLKELNERLRLMREVSLPAMLQEMGLQSASLPDGTTVAIESAVHAKLSEKQKSAAYQWLRDNGHDEVIKAQLILRFGKGEDDQRTEVERRLHDLMAEELISTYETKEDVHPSTYKALIRELMRDGVAVPLDTLGVFIRSEAVVTSNNGKN